MVPLGVEMMHGAIKQDRVLSNRIGYSLTEMIGTKMAKYFRLNKDFAELTKIQVRNS